MNSSDVLSQLSTLNTSDGTNSTSNSSGTFGFQPQPVDIPSIVILSALIPLICAGNLLVIIVFVKYQRIRTATNCFLFNLAISDLAVGLLLIPFWIFLSLKAYAVSPDVFVVYSMIDITCSVASMANLACVSIERLYGVTYPFHHMNMSVNKAAIAALCTWFYAICISLVHLGKTKVMWTYWIISGLGFIVPFLVTLLCYCGIVRKIRQKRNPESTPPPQGRAQTKGRENKSIRTLFIVTIVFCICWLPIIIGAGITIHCASCTRYVHKRPFIRTFPKLLHYIHSSINPILYALLSPSFRSAYRQLFFGRKRLTRARVDGRPQRLSLDPSHTGISVLRKSNVGFLDRDKVVNNGSPECSKHSKVIQNNNEDDRESPV